MATDDDAEGSGSESDDAPERDATDEGEDGEASEGETHVKPEPEAPSEDECAPSEEISAYELERQRNIQRNQEVLLLLGLSSNGSSANATARGATPSPKPASKKRKAPPVARDQVAVAASVRVQPARAQRHQGSYCEIPALPAEPPRAKQPQSASREDGWRRLRRVKDVVDPDYEQADDEDEEMASFCSKQPVLEPPCLRSRGVGAVRSSHEWLPSSLSFEVAERIESMFENTKRIGEQAAKRIAYVETHPESVTHRTPLHAVGAGFECNMSGPYTSVCFYARVPFADVACAEEEEDAAIRSVVQQYTRECVDLPRGSIVVWNSSLMTIEKFAQTPLAEWIQSRDTGTVHRVGDAYDSISSIKVARKFVMDGILVLCCDRPLPYVEFGGYRMHYDQLLDRILFPKEGRATISAVHVDFMHNLVPLVVMPNGKRLESAFRTKEFRGTALDVGSLRFEHPKAIAYRMKMETVHTSDNYHLRLEVQKGDACIAFVMLPMRIHNSIHTLKDKGSRRDGIMVQELQEVIDVPWTDNMQFKCPLALPASVAVVEAFP